MHMAWFVSVAEHSGVSAEMAMTLGEPFWEGHTALPAGEGIPYDDGCGGRRRRISRRRSSTSSKVSDGGMVIPP
jgi:hypothetical protein